MKNTYYKNVTLGFIVRVDKIGVMKMGPEWISVPEVDLRVISGTVVYDLHNEILPGSGVWPIGYFSNSWAFDAFKECDRFVVIEAEGGMWEVRDLDTVMAESGTFPDAEAYYGGYKELGSWENRDLRLEIEWDSHNSGLDVSDDIKEEVEEFLRNIL